MDRYGLRASEYRLPKSQAKRQAWAEQVGQDGQELLCTLYLEAMRSDLRGLPAVETLRQVWLQNFVMTDDQIHWRENDNTPPTGRYINSPYDTEARYATKRQIYWIGYKIHLTESYGGDQPNLITNVETTNAAVSDDPVTERIHASLAEHKLLPDKHVADTGYVNSTLFVGSQTSYGIELIGPTRGDNHWHAKDGEGFAARDFRIDAVSDNGLIDMPRNSPPIDYARGAHHQQ